MRLNEVVVSFWYILLASFTAAGLVIATMLFWVGINALIHQHRLMREAAISPESIGQALRSIYDHIVRESLPNDFLDMLRKLTRKSPQHPAIA